MYIKLLTLIVTFLTWLMGFIYEVRAPFRRAVEKASENPGRLAWNSGKI